MMERREMGVLADDDDPELQAALASPEMQMLLSQPRSSQQARQTLSVPPAPHAKAANSRARPQSPLQLHPCTPTERLPGPLQAGVPAWDSQHTQSCEQGTSPEQAASGLERPAPQGSAWDYPALRSRRAASEGGTSASPGGSGQAAPRQSKPSDAHVIELD
jgi:hypothetical protein